MLMSVRVWVFAMFVLMAVRSCVAVDEKAVDSEWRKIEVNKTERKYLIHVPPAKNEKEKRPLVIVLHGGGGNPAQMERVGFNALAARENFIVVYPQGTASGLKIGSHWNDGRTATMQAHRDGIDDVAFIAQMIDSLIENDNVDPKRVYATGISNGAIMSHRLGAELSEKITAIAGICGSLAEGLEKSFAPKNPVSVLMINGTKDELAPYDGGAIALPAILGGAATDRGRITSTDTTLKLWVKANACAEKADVGVEVDKVANDGTSVVTSTYGGGKDGSNVVLMKVIGGGHTWPGGVQYLPKALVGPVSKEFNATETVWEFFKGKVRQ